MNWRKSLKGKVLAQEPLKKHTSFRIGGPARFFIEPSDIDDLRFLLVQAKRYKIPVTVIGAGTNILASDRGLKKIVLHLSARCFQKISRDGNRLICGSGVSLAKVVSSAREHGLSGLEFLAGIPGTLGGALAGNAGAWGREVGSRVKEITVMDHSGAIKTLERKQIKFAYRSSGLAKYVILEAVLKLCRGNRPRIRKKISAYLSARRNKQEYAFPNAGCVFRNPSAAGAAGALIDLCGLKGVSAGGAQISLRHANFIVNTGSASAANVLALMREAAKKVKERFGVDLQPEIKLWF
ncbi:MAG: UDP-N-acetylmuramate dehydrogenase [Candidatus Omnitrophota bacterium]|nr:UDP-N-acetylmuramate dehydrogenase [Candidatus Omnitrophota bacterium]